MVESGPKDPRALHHYTTQNGLIGIIRDRVVWATNICYMNDAREFNYAMELLREAMASFECGDTEQFAFVLPFVRPQAWDVYPNVFVFSMSEHKDRLGLWRAYAGGVAGYSIGFSTSELREAARKAGFHLVRCTYNREEQQQLIAKFVEDIRSWVNSLSAGEFSMRQHTLIQNFWDNFALLAAQLKHPSFSEEAEWRLISDGMYVSRPIDGKELSESKAWVTEPRAIRIRTGQSTLTPFVDISLSNNEELLPIYSLLVGPSIDPTRGIHAVQMLLLSCKQHSTKGVGASTIPYRTW
ncbi:Protein of unknown function (DUF2971) [Nitrosospira sp. Nsp5]|uniref:DUF2971 domain-containing protein n=1 Tax=Nitrosospira multiformis TaxID=1231 RepID=A0ABY0TH06_9PROT|nr:MULTISPECIES: DUF2971 domain-containing protein [Nitrosospira]PTR10514.1 Protein of unknown function (DUF2971) [Nitrosospira sp. Nsp5]SDQ82031.1 Protein of unknown function [Nitrosospira multiformis]